MEAFSFARATEFESFWWEVLVIIYLHEVEVQIDRASGADFTVLSLFCSTHYNSSIIEKTILLAS